MDLDDTLDLTWEDEVTAVDRTPCRLEIETEIRIQLTVPDARILLQTLTGTDAPRGLVDALRATITDAEAG